MQFLMAWWPPAIEKLYCCFNCNFVTVVNCKINMQAIWYTTKEVMTHRSRIVCARREPHVCAFAHVWGRRVTYRKLPLPTMWDLGHWAQAVGTDSSTLINWAISSLTRFVLEVGILGLFLASDSFLVLLIPLPKTPLWGLSDPVCEWKSDPVCILPGSGFVSDVFKYQNKTVLVDFSLHPFTL